MRHFTALPSLFAVLTAAAVPLISRAANAETFYVTQSGQGTRTGASYANAWSEAQFETASNWSASETTSRIDPGDTVYLCGTFPANLSSEIRPAGNGSSTEAIVIRGDCAGAPFLVTGSHASNSGVRVRDRSYLTLSNLRFESDLSVEIRIQDSHHITVQNSTIQTSRNKGIETSGSGHHITIAGNTIRSMAPGGGGADGIAIWQGPWDHVYIYRNRISDFTHSGINVMGYYPETTPPTLNEVSYVYIYENEIDLPTRGYGHGFGFNESNHIYFFRNYVHGLRARSQISARDVFVYNNVFANTRNCCSTATEAGCSEAYANCADADKRYYGTGQALDLSAYSSAPTNVHIVNNMVLHAAESGVRVLTSEPIVGLKVINNAFANTSNANSPSDDPAGSSATWIDYSFAVETATLSDFTFTHNLVHSPVRTVDIRYGSNAYTVAQWNAFGTSEVVTDANVANNPGISGYVPASASSPLVNTGTALVGPPDPSGGLPSNGTYAHALDPSTDWPNAVVVANQNDYGGGWERGAFVYTTGQANLGAASLAGEQSATTSSALGGVAPRENAGGCTTVAFQGAPGRASLWALALAGGLFLERRRRLASTAKRRSHSDTGGFV